jgi:hypothetical protein
MEANFGLVKKEEVEQYGAGIFRLEKLRNSSNGFS